MGRKSAGIVALVLASVVSIAQQAKPLVFKEEVFDFGNVKETGGPVLHEFVFTNNSGRPVKILTVQASCGCTTPAWSKEAVAPGKTGYIQASFNPKGRPGYFNKTLTVTTDLEASPILLQIKGQVEGGGKPAPTDYQMVNGSWKLRTLSFNVGKVFIRDEFVTREFQFVNAGAKPVSFTGKVVAPEYIKVDITPAVVGSGEKGSIKVSYNGKLKNRYGFQSDNIEITTDDEINPVKTFNVYATLEDYFPPLSSEELAKAPRLVVGNALDLGRIKQNTESTGEIQFTNSGKKELSIKSLQGNCTCLAVTASKYTLKPGETSSMRITFTPNRGGTQTKAVTIYSNDPQGPVQRVTLTAYVEN